MSGNTVSPSAGSPSGVYYSNFDAGVFQDPEANTQNTAAAAAQQWLAQNPDASAQDIINWGYANGGNTYAGADEFLQQLGIDIDKLVANRQASASGIIGGAQPLPPSGQGQAQTSDGSTTGGGQATSQMQTLAANSRQVANGMCSTGWCARGVEAALNETYGLNISGNGNDVDNQLEKNGWQKVDMSLEDALKVPGLVLVWEKTSTEDGSKYGHTAITQGDGHSSTSDHLEKDTVAGSSGRTGLSVWAPPGAVTQGAGAPAPADSQADASADLPGDLQTDASADSQDGAGATPASGSYTVKRGDTLWGIAKAHGVSLQSLIAANPQISNPDLIYSGQNVNIPGGSPDQGSPATPEPSDPVASPAGGTQVTLPNGSTVNAPNAKAAAAVNEALQQLGKPYVWGAADPNKGFDCSGLTSWAYRQAGVSLPHQSWGQAVGQKVAQQDLAPGDLVVWKGVDQNGNSKGHVAMYVGNGQMIEAPAPGKDVRLSPLRTSNNGETLLGFYRPTAA